FEDVIRHPSGENVIYPSLSRSGIWDASRTRTRATPEHFGNGNIAATRPVIRMGHMSRTSAPASNGHIAADWWIAGLTPVRVIRNLPPPRPRISCKWNISMFEVAPPSAVAIVATGERVVLAIITTTSSYP